MKPTIRRLHELLEYDPLTGLFRWRNPTARQAPSWFRGSHSVRQYRRLYIDGKHYLAHVVAWALKKGYWPDHEIDHRDRNQGNNKWRNLRKATRSQNAKNRSLNRNSKTGIRGVSVLGNRYRVTITVNRKRIHLGVFDSIEEATIVRQTNERKHYGNFSGQ